MRVQRDFGVIMRPQEFRALETNGAVAERSAFRTASDYADV